MDVGPYQLPARRPAPEAGEQALAMARRSECCGEPWLRASAWGHDQPDGPQPVRVITPRMVEMKVTTTGRAEHSQELSA